MSRSRPYKKNDNAWVEQRNWTHVRKVVGYRRLDSDVELAILQELYGCFTIYKNFFQPTMKLAEKVRAGGKIQRKYDEPKTPYQRLMESGQISAAARKRLTAQYESLNVAQLRRQIEGLRNRLFHQLDNKNGAEPSAGKRHGPGIRVGGAAHAIWMRKMMKGEKP